MRGIGLVLLLALGCGRVNGLDVFVSGQDGYHTYRIPAAVRTVKGTLLAFCEGRKDSRRDWGNIDVLVKRSRDGGRTWSAATVVADFGEDTIGNPAPVVDRRTGTVWLLLTRNPASIQEKQIEAGLSGATRTVWVTHSEDDGLSWANAVEITAAVKRADWSWYATGPGNGIQLRSGRLVVACDHVRAADGVRNSHVILSDDGGKTWRLGGIAGPQCNESTVAERRDGALLLNMRHYGGKNRRAVAVSKDAGETWSAPVLDEALVEPVCQGSLLRFGKGANAVLLFANPAAATRVNMTVRLSRDDGKSWAGSKVVHPGPSAYSNLVELDGRTVGLLYERGAASAYETIAFERIPLRRLLEK